MIYFLKEIFYNNNFYKIVLQNENGPCPIICICNILILKGWVTVSSKDTIDTETLNYVVNTVITDLIQQKKESKKEQSEKEYDQLMDVIYSLESGLDISVFFSGIHSFGPSPAVQLFKLLDIELVHGWVVDPKAEFSILSRSSYNIIEEQIALNDDNNNNNTQSEDNNLHENLISTQDTQKEQLLNRSQKFMKETSTQLTEYGLSLLRSQLKPDMPCALFRNNHFSVCIRHLNEIYTLVSDIGYLDFKTIVWERLDSATSTTLCLPDFITPYKDIPSTSTTQAPSLETVLQENMNMNKSIDAIVEDQKLIEKDIKTGGSTIPNQIDNSDAVIAEMLQEEEYEEAGNSKKKCSIM